MISVLIEGPPVSWTPSRVIHGRHSYNPKYREKEYAQWQVRNQYKADPLQGPVNVELKFAMPIPKGTSKKKRSMMISGEIKHVTKNDLDNLAKFAIDCIKKIVIVDDNQVCSLYACKFYGENPGTSICISFAK